MIMQKNHGKYHQKQNHDEYHESKINILINVLNQDKFHHYEKVNHRK